MTVARLAILSPDVKTEPGRWHNLATSQQVWLNAHPGGADSLLNVLWWHALQVLLWVFRAREVRPALPT